MDLQLLAALTLALALLSALATALAVAYAQRRRLVDEPGGRRLHKHPTVRGAGSGLMLVLLLASLGIVLTQPQHATMMLLPLVGLLLLMLAGYWDDHRPLPARWRLGAQSLAALLLVAAVLPFDPPTQALAMLGTLWLMNLYNFIDGSDLFAASHGVLLGIVVALLAGLAGDSLLMLLALALAAVLAGFLPFNWPPARAFMGDVASAPIGYWAALLLLLGWQHGSLDPLLPLVLLSGLIADATLTLWQRVRSGRRWYQAHRSHLYQWMRRRGYSALSVCALYLAWAVAVTSLHLLWPLELGGSPVAFLIVYALAIFLWLFARRRLLEPSSRSSAA
jgi:UDP-N-acetylmuramyl pentapeptide phosphotransferase/UDP-N-acetylglucosamine-1-phosphate transferase